MGKNNRQRRQEKQRRRERQRAGRAAPSGPGGFRYRDDELQTDFLVIMAATAFQQGDDERSAALVAQVMARPDARRRTAQAINDALDLLAEGHWEPDLIAHLVRRRSGSRHAKLIQAGLTSSDDVPTAIEALAVLLRLPPLPALPIPSQADDVDARILAKVRGLLAKAESTTFAEEAEALSAKAQELMARHAIDQALAVAEARPERPGGRRVPLDDPYEDAKSLLLGAVARANRCRAVHVLGLAHATVLGFEADLAAVELLFTSLLVQANRAMLAAGRSDRRSRQRGFRSSFLSAYANRVGQRLEASTADQVADADFEHDGRLLPVLAARTDAVEEAVTAMFGDRLQAIQPKISDHRGWIAGHAAADQAELAFGPEIRAAG